MTPITVDIVLEKLAGVWSDLASGNTSIQNRKPKAKAALDPLIGQTRKVIEEKAGKK